MGDLLVANDRILPRESLLYRRFLETCQEERGLGSIAFTEGLQEREMDALLEALTQAPDRRSASGLRAGGSAISTWRRPVSRTGKAGRGSLAAL
jgi:hypothetical protein